MNIKELFNTEKRVLNDFIDHIDQGQVESCLEALKACKGIIFLTGVGKSGFVAMKIATSMTSTGTRALYLSPVDALHGDIGIISADDCVIFISKSGESDELLHIIPYVRNKGATLIAFVCNGISRLAKAVHHQVVLPVEQELCPFNVSPTLSTQAALILGDVLVVALMAHKEMTLDQFAANHPAGRLGKRITMKVKDLMLQGPALPFCAPTDHLVDILVELSDKKAGCILIINTQQELLGIFTDGDLRRALQKHGHQALDKKIQDLMIKNPRHTHPETLAAEALRLMEANPNFPITVLPVIDHNRHAVGLIKLHDILQSGL